MYADPETQFPEPDRNRPPSSDSRTDRSWRSPVVVGVVLGLALGAGGVAGAGAAMSSGTGPSGAPAGGPPSHGARPDTRPTAAGTVKSVGRDSFVLTTKGGATVTVDVSASTTYAAPGASAGFSDLKAGQFVAVTGTESSGTVTATRVLIAPAGTAWGSGGVRPEASGTVQSVGTNSFVLTTAGGSSVTVDVSSSTTYVDPGASSASLADVKAGQRVAVTGRQSSGTVSATRVVVLPAGAAGRPSGTRPTASGTVKSVGTDSFVLTTAGGTSVTVDVSSSTTYTEPGVTSASLKDVKPGARVAVSGTEGAGKVAARTVAILPAGTGVPPAAGGPSGGPASGPPPGAFGTVTSVGPDSFVLSTRSGATVTVEVSPATTYREPGISSPSFSDVKTGQSVGAMGTVSSGVVTATSVFIAPAGFGGGHFGGGSGSGAFGYRGGSGADSGGGTSGGSAPSGSSAPAG